MDWETVFKLITASIAPIGLGGGIIFALSSWLGKVWANRILADQTHELGSTLEKTKRELDFIKETTLRFQNEKILTYRAIIDVVSRILSSFDAHEMGRLQPHEAGSRFDEFNEQRMRVYGYLAMLAPKKSIEKINRVSVIDFGFQLLNQ